MSLTQPRQYYWIYSENNDRVTMPWLQISTLDNSYGSNLKLVIANTVYQGATAIGYVDMGYNTDQVLARNEDWLVLTSDIYDFATYNLSLSGVEYITAPLNKTVDLEVISKFGFGTNGSLHSITTGVGNHTIDYDGATRDSTLTMLAGWDTVNLIDHPDIPGTQYWTLIRRDYSELDAYSLFSGYRIRMESGGVSMGNNLGIVNYGEIERIFLANARSGSTRMVDPGNEYPSSDARSLDTNIDLRSYELVSGSVVNKPFSDSFNLAYFNFIRYTSDNIWSGQATIYDSAAGRYSTPGNTSVDGAEVLDVIGTQRNGTHDLVVTEQANLIDGKFRLYAFNLESRVYNVFNDVYLGTAGVDGKSYSTNAATPEGRVALYGFGGKDILTGGAGNDYLFGGEAEYNQLVSGATGNQLTGGPGADYFGVGNTNANGDVDGAVSWAGYNGGQAQIGYAADQIMDWHAGTDTLRVLSNGVGIISGLYGVSGMAGANTIDLRATAAVVTSDQNNSGPRGGTTSGWDSVAGNLDYIYANQATRDAESIKNEADVTVVNEGLIVARGLEGNDVIYGSPGNDYLYGNQGDNTLDLSSGGADRAFYDTRSGKQFLGGFASASNDKVYLAKNVIDAFRGGETFTELGFTYTVNKTVVDTATDGWTYTYKNGEGYSQGIDFLYGVTYKAYLSNSFGSQPYSNVESQTMGFAADVTTFVAGAVMIGVAVGLCFIPFVGPALAAPLFVSGALLEAGKIYSEVGNKSLGSVEHLNATYDLGGGNNFQSNYAYVLHNDLQYVNINGVNTTPTVPSTTPASGGSANIDNVPFLHFFHGAYTYDGFTPVLELNPGWGYGGDSDNGVHAYFIVYSNTETFVYFVTSQDNLIENGEAFKVAEVNGHRSASDFVVYDSNQDPYNQRADAPVVLKKPTISAVYENSAPAYTASVPNKAYTESPSLRVTGTIASIDPSKTPTTSTKNIVLYDVMQDPDVDGNPIPVATVAISNGDTSFSINDPRSLGQIIIQTDFDTSGSTTAADGSLSQPVKSTGQLRSLELDNTFEYQDRRISYYTSLLNDVDGDGSMIIEIRSNTWNVIDNGPSNATVNGGNGSDTLQLESTSLHLNRAIDAQIVSIENINVKAPNGPGLSVSVSGGQIADVTVIDPNVMVANGTYTLQFKDSDGTYTDPSTAWTLTVLDRQVTAITKGNGGSGFSDTGSYVTADWIPLGVNIDVRAQTEGFNINAYNGADTIVGAQGNDNIYGLAGNDTIDGGNGNDTITGGVGLDSLLGGNGADIFVISAVSDFANGEVIAGGANSAGTVDKLQLSQQAVVGTFGAFISLPSTGTYTAAQLSSQVTGVEVIELTVNASYSLTLSDGIYAGVDANGDGTADNTLTITPTVNITNDVTIVGGAVSGNNELVVQDSGYLDGNDSMVGGAGNDSLQGGDGNDSLVGGIGHNLLQGGNGNDSILGDVGNDSLQGGNGNDSLTGGAGVDSISGGDNNDTIVMAVNLTSADTIDGGAGSDTLTFTDSNGAATDLDNVTFVETIILGNAATTVTTVQGLIGATATLTVDGTALSGVALTWNGSAETDGGKFSITGGTGDDSITGGNGADTLLGSDGNDTLIGGDGADSILGGNHNDEVRVASAAALDLDSTIVGGSGTDTVHITSADLTIADVNFTDVDSVEILRLTGASSVTLGSEATAAGITNVRTGTGATSVTRTDTTTTTVDATDLGNDTTLTLGDTGVTTNFTVTNLTGDLDSSSVAGNLTIRVSDNTVDNDIAINLSESSTTITGGVVGDTLLITQVDDPAVTGIQVIDLTANLSNATIAMGGGRQTIKVGVGIYAINPGSGDAAGEDRVEFNVAGSAAVPTDLSVDDATLLTRINSINNYNADEIDFTNTDTTGANLSITTAGGTFTTNIDGLVTNFGAVTADLGDKISAVRAALDTWSGLAGNDNNRIVLFTHANGASTDTYAYGSGSVAAGDDQIVRIVDDSLNQITTGSSFVLNVAPPTSALTTATSLLPGNTTWYSGSTTVAYSNFTPGNDGTTGVTGDGVTGNTNQLIRNSAGNFGAQQGGGDDYFTTISVPNSMWSTGLNMFGTVYTQIMMGSNGYITFGSGFRGFVPSGIDTYTRSPMIAAQFDDLYTNAGNRNVADGAGPSGTSLGTHQMYFFQDANRLVFTWDNVGLYSNGVSDSQTSAGGVGSAFQIILHKPVGEAADVQNFGIEIRYEEVTLQYSSATAGWTAGDRINYALINPSKTNLASTAFQSNVGINGVWAWLVSGGFITASTYLPDVGLTSPKDTNSVLVRGFNATGYTLGGEAASQFTVAPGSAANTATITTIANATFNLWKDQYVDEVATLTVRPTGPSGVGALETINLSLVRNTDLDGRIDGVDLAVRTAGSAVITVAAGGTLDDAADADLGQTIGAFPAITTITATGSGSTINISSQSEDYTLNGNSGVDIITGGSGSDTITGGGGADQLLGGAGNGDDVFIIASAADHAAGEVITGGSHVVGDQVRFTSTSAQTLTLLSTVTEIEEVRISNAAGSTSGVTNESINASAVTGNIALTGNNGNNTLTGNDGNNTIDGGGGADTLLGGNGADVFWIDSSVTDSTGVGESIDGGSGIDQLVVAGGTNAIDLSNDTLNAIEVLELTKSVTGAADSNAQSLTMTEAQLSGLTTINAAQGDKITLNDAVLSGTMQTLVLDGQLTLQLADVAGNFLSLDPSNFDGTNDLLVLDAASLTHDLEVVGSGELQGALSIVSGSGDDDIAGTQSSVGDTIVTNGGNDYITGSVGYDSIDAGSGNDTVQMSVESRDSIDAGTDTDWLMPTGNASDTVVIDLSVSGGSDQVLTINGVADSVVQQNFEHLDASAMTGGGVKVTARAAGSWLIGSAQDDTLIGGAGADTLLGRDGNDVLVINNDVVAGERYDGGNGYNTLLIQSDTNLGVVTVLDNIDTITLLDNVDVIFSAAALSGDTLTINGTGDNSNESVSVYGGTGNDVINLSGISVDSNDMRGLTIDGGAGDDTITGTSGIDTLIGGDGNDVFRFSSNTQTSTSNTTSQMDVIAEFNILDDQINLVDMAGGSTTLTATTVAGGNADDYVVSWTIAGTTNYVLLAGTGVTGGLTFSTTGGVATATSTAPTGISFDVFTIADTGVTVSGNGPFRAFMTPYTVTNPNRNDNTTYYTKSSNYGASNSHTFDFAVLKAAAGSSASNSDVSPTIPHPVTNAVLTIQNTNNGLNNTYAAYVFVGDDTVGARNDTLTANLSDKPSLMYGFDGNDTITGNTGHDTLFGGNGSDSLLGGNGNDVLNGGIGSDVLSGDAGADVLDGGAAGDSLFVGSDSDVDRVVLSAASHSFVGSITSGTTDLSASVDVVSELVNGDQIDLSALGLNSSITGAALTSTISAVSSAGTYGLIPGTYVGGVFTQNTGSDTHTLLVYDTDGVAGGNLGAMVLSGVMSGTATSGVITLSGGGLTITGTSSAESVNGASGNDTLLGDAGDDTLSGGNGNDVLSGGSGIDVLIGGSGVDLFSFSGVGSSSDRDIVQDFQVGAGGDQIGLDVDFTNTQWYKSNPLTDPIVYVEETFNSGDIITSQYGSSAYDLSGARNSDIIEFKNLDYAGFDLSARVDGVYLLAMLNGGVTRFSDTAGAGGVYLLAYDNGNAYLYYGSSSGNTIYYNEIALIGVIQNVAVDSLTSDNFKMVP